MKIAGIINHQITANLIYEEQQRIKKKHIKIPTGVR